LWQPERAEQPHFLCGKVFIRYPGKQFLAEARMDLVDIGIAFPGQAPGGIAAEDLVIMAEGVQVFEWPVIPEAQIKLVGAFPVVKVVHDLCQGPGHGDIAIQLTVLRGVTQSVVLPGQVLERPFAFLPEAVDHLFVAEDEVVFQHSVQIGVKALGSLFNTAVEDVQLGFEAGVKAGGAAGECIPIVLVAALAEVPDQVVLGSPDPLDEADQIPKPLIGFRSRGL
jgi:hypothetical protein